MARVTQAHVDSRRTDILEAALRMFAQKGVVAATMQEVAGEAGISTGAIYRYFPGKDELLQAVFEEISERDKVSFMHAAGDISSPADALLNVGRVVTESLKLSSVQDETMLVLEEILAEHRGDGSRLRRRDVQQAHLATLEQLVRQAQEAGGLDREIDPWAFAVILLCCINGVRVLSLEMEDSIDMDEVFGALQSVLFRFAPSSPSKKEET
ncbi:MAG: TetR/AcrR family transcriptional regulator [Gaiellales bacterium]|nr:TetR/AcrR family transcriptional regulator [Gaiellales bacterium]